MIQKTDNPGKGQITGHRHVHWANGCEHDRPEAHREGKRCGRERNEARLKLREAKQISTATAVLTTMIIVDRDVLRQTHTVVATVLVIVFSRHYVKF